MGFTNWDFLDEHYSILPETLINHVFLLKHLPQERESYFEKIEDELLKYFVKVLEEKSCITKCSPFTYKTFETWNTLQMKSESLNKILCNIETVESTCLYVRNQNCTILFTKLDPNYMRVVTFRASLPNEHITGSCGSFVVTYPETVDIVPISPLLLSKSLSVQFNHFTNNQYAIAMPVTRKGDVDHIEIREASYPYLISDFFVTLLCPIQPKNYSEEMAKMTEIKIQKKLRDQINWSNCEIPFRRSGLWMSVKVVLRLSLQEEMESDLEAEIIYKTIILEMLISLANEYRENGGDCWDIISQVTVKLARRIKKLSTFPTTSNSDIETQREEVTKLAIQTIKEMQSNKPIHWKTADLITSKFHDRDIKAVDNPKCGWNAECVHKMEDLTNYLSSERGKIPPLDDVGDNLKLVDSVSFESNLISLEMEYSIIKSPNEDTDIHMNQTNIWMHRVEFFVGNDLNANSSSDHIFNLLLAYTQAAFPVYSQANPMCFSRMTLVVLKMIAVLDEIAVQKYPLLKKYHCGIQPEMFHHLLVPEKKDIILLENLQNYFAKRLELAILGNWLEEKSKIGEMDFQIQFAKQSQEMISKKIEIEKATESKILEKQIEIETAKNEALEIKKRLDLLRCTRTWNAEHQRSFHDNDCKRCTVYNEWNRKLASVSRYQKPLPEKEILKDLVIFEYLIPSEIVNLRDAVTILLEEILNFSIFSLSENEIKTNWIDFLASHGYQQSTKLHRCVRLGSDVYETLRTHYGRGNPDVRYSPNNFILENALKCQYYSVKHLDIKYPDNPFSFNVSDTIENDASPYQSLQFAFGQERANENEVICNQYQCPQDLTIKEFITFGSLRCGHNIQLRNLYAAISSQILSLDKGPVLQLIMQTLWELGPGQREIHEDFENSSQFCIAFLDLMEKYGNENKDNWGNPIVMLSLTVIVIRILEMNEDIGVKEKAVKILRSYRNILDEWYTKLHELIPKIPKNGSEKNERHNLIELKLKAAIGSAFTFNVSSDLNIACILNQSSDYTFWLKTLHRLWNLVAKENVLNSCSISPFMKSLLRHARLTIPLNLEQCIWNHRNSDLHIPVLNSALHSFVCSEWSLESKSSESPKFEFATILNKRHAYQAEYETDTGVDKVCVDILRGTFYVNGYPPSTLPETVTRNHLFKSFFTNSDFRVQRNSNTFKTIDLYEGHHYQFTQDEENLVIRRCLSFMSYEELLPRNIFEAHIPLDFIHNYTQWYNSETRQVYFHKSNETNYAYKMIQTEDANWYIRKPNTPLENDDAFLVSIKSEGYLKITEILKNIDTPEYINVFFYFNKRNMNDFKIVAVLRRMNLQFTLNKTNGLLYCNNYPDFYIPTSDGQDLGTLYGLNCGLVLQKETVEEPSGIKKLFLIQHGQISITPLSSSTRHQSVTVTTSNYLRNPPYFVYEVDDVLKRLKPGNNKSAWLYLALLHAATSNSIPDAFTQLTGTEMSMWILQSGFVWSCSPYDTECLNTLDQIASLSPKHTYYPSHLQVMQNTKWPEGLVNNSYAAYDGYLIVTQKLLQNSNRLRNLFPNNSNESEEEKELDFVLGLSIRSYFRYINIYNTAAHLNSDILKYSQEISVTMKLPAFDFIRRNDNLVKLAQLRRLICTDSFQATMGSFICTQDAVSTKSETDLKEKNLDDWFETKFRNGWLELYDLALQSSCNENYHQMTLICGAILYAGKGTIDQILNLHNISVLQTNFSVKFPRSPTPLLYGTFFPKDFEFDTKVIIKKLQKHSASPPALENFKTDQEREKCEMEYKTSLDHQVRKSIQRLETFWPIANINMDNLQWALNGQHLLNANDEVLFKLNKKGFTYWFSNRSFRLFVQNIDEILRDQLKSIRTTCSITCTTERMQYLVMNLESDKIDSWSVIPTTEEIEEEKFDAVINICFNAMATHNADNMSYMERREKCLNYIEQFLITLSNYTVDKDPISYSLREAGIHQRLAPIVLLRNTFNNSSGKSYCFVKALAVLWAKLKRLNRMILFQSQTQKYEVELENELKSERERNWSQNENPEWLLLELELNISIRPVQVDVARRMIKMPGNTNGVMQLNMGEGKTSVIVPMVVSALTSKDSGELENMLCRVTVMNSIFATNHNILSFALGGFLNKRVYIVPCRRDFEIQNCLNEIQETYLECQRLGGVVLALPEHRLSFKLQMYNNFLQNENRKECHNVNDTGLKIYEIETWLRKNARDIVDESDEIFSVKYQLVYTAGKQLPLDGGSMRWKVGQQISEYICSNQEIIGKSLSANDVEFDPSLCEKYPEQFPLFRIINEECKRLFNDCIATAVVNGGIFLLGGNLSEGEKELIMEFLTNEEISVERHEEFIRMTGLTEEKKLALLVISGYLKGGILFTALKKRWRVEYGVKTTLSGGRLIAVPFRAKDVAAERTEFGHPDMAIILTLLSYYYSGLSDNQLRQCFLILKTRITAPKGVYNAWFRKIPVVKISSAVKLYEGINLEDYEQRTYLFGLLRKNKAVIDFWLDNVVFPKECKQFPGKLVTNAWDLCHERYIHPTTGFSGTDDTSVLLPVPMSQQNMAALEKTNLYMEKLLVNPINSYKQSFSMGTSCEEIIKAIVKDGLRVLIDAGALMLQLSNDKIAQLWLETDSYLKGVIYFNDKGEMVVKVRHTSTDQLLTLSSFKDDMEDCAVYLDDQHTRGTDLKLPNHFNACVSVGSGIRRDKLIQACMRMRKLGRKQSVHFYLSHDVNSKIKAQKKSQGHLSVNITVADILYWAKRNSEIFVKDNMIYWAGNARNYAQNLIADDLFAKSDKSVIDQIILGNRIQDTDAQTLEQMYGTFHRRVSLDTVIPTWFFKLKNKLKRSERLPSFAMQILKKFENIALQKIRMCTSEDTEFSLNSLLDEEQEKELEPEQDEQLESYRPRSETPHEPKLHSNVDKILRDGIFQGTMSTQPGISRLSEIFCETKISSLIQYKCWGDQWYVTDDFKKVLATSGYTDSFLRPIRYFVSFGNLNSTKTVNLLLVLSQFEVDKTIKHFRLGKANDTLATLHMFTARWMEGQETFENEHKLQLPDNEWGSSHAKLTEDLMAPLYIAAGNLFFISMEEQKAFAKFLGFKFKQWTDEEKELHKQGLILNTGFVLPECKHLRDGCLFIDDPSEMVQGIMKLRNEAPRETDHTVTIMEQCAFLEEKMLRK